MFVALGAPTTLHMIYDFKIATESLKFATECQQPCVLPAAPVVLQGAPKIHLSKSVLPPKQHKTENCSQGKTTNTTPTIVFFCNTASANKQP